MGGIVGVAGITITIIEPLFILLWSGQLLSISVGLLANSYIYQLVWDRVAKNVKHYMILKFLSKVYTRYLIQKSKNGHLKQKIIAHKTQNRVPKGNFCQLITRHIS